MRDHIDIIITKISSMLLFCEHLLAFLALPPSLLLSLHSSIIPPFFLLPSSLPSLLHPTKLITLRGSPWGFP